MISLNIRSDARNLGRNGRCDTLARGRRWSVAAAALLAVGAGACDQVDSMMGRAPAQVSARALQAAATEPEVKAFYTARQWQAAWSAGQAKALMQALEAAPQHGFDATRFTQLIHAAEGDATRDAELTLAALAYARALAQGVVDPKKIHPNYELARPKVDVMAGLDQALKADGVAAWLNGLAPQDAEYAALSKAYLTYRAEADRAKASPIADGPELKAGMSDARVPAVLQRLSVAGYLPGQPAAAPAPAAGEAAAPTPVVFTRDASEALKSLQRDARLPATGRIDAATVAALNEAPADRARQLAVNMERRRWLARELQPTRIDVNTASAQLAYYHDGQTAWTSRVVVGDPKNPTPALGDVFSQLVVNPPWNVPDGIAKEEILPKGDGYLAAQDMYVQDGRVVQRPGPKAALGLVKFDMQNDQAIYLHDTPAKAVFKSEARHRSHGCARVENAVDFARMLATERGKGEAFDTALQSGETKVVGLDDKIAVRLLYHTAYLVEGDRLTLADDPYGWDDQVGQALGLEPSRRRAAAVEAILLGP